MGVNHEDYEKPEKESNKNKNIPRLDPVLSLGVKDGHMVSRTHDGQYREMICEEATKYIFEAANENYVYDFFIHDEDDYRFISSKTTKEIGRLRFCIMPFNNAEWVGVGLSLSRQDEIRMFPITSSLSEIITELIPDGKRKLVTVSIRERNEIREIKKFTTTAAIEFDFEVSNSEDLDHDDRRLLRGWVHERAHMAITDACLGDGNRINRNILNTKNTTVSCESRIKDIETKEDLNK